MRSASTGSLILILTASLALSATATHASQCTALRSPGPALAESIGLLYGDDIDTRLVERAVALWQACGNYRHDFPPFLNGQIGTRTIYIERGGASRTSRCGSFSGRRIVLYRSAIGRQGRPRICGDLAQNLAHELGHVLGLLDIGRDRSCREHIMARITPKTTHNRRVTDAECRAVGSRWLTGAEQRARRERLSDFGEAVAGL